MESSNNNTDANTLVSPRKREAVEPQLELTRSKREKVALSSPSLEEKIELLNEKMDEVTVDNDAVVNEKGEEVVQKDEVEYAKEGETECAQDEDDEYVQNGDVEYSQEEEADYEEEEFEEAEYEYRARRRRTKYRHPREMYKEVECPRQEYGRRSNIYCHPREIFKDQLMLSQWCLEKPNYLKTDWIFLLCPNGKRNLVIAADGSTRHFSKNGALQGVFPSHLPGGCRMQGAKGRKSSTVLDCIYSEVNKMFYILDMMSWDGFSYYDIPTKQRMMTLEYKMQYLEEVGYVDRVNPYKFKRLDYYNWDGGYMNNLNGGCLNKPGISDILRNPEPLPFEANDDLDGILLYHRDAIYQSGETSEVQWIKPFMAPEVMGGIHISENLLNQRPADYQGIQVYVEQFYKEQQERKRKEAEERKKKIEFVDMMVKMRAEMSTSMRMQKKEHEQKIEELDEMKRQWEEMMSKMEAEGMKRKNENGSEAQQENVGIVVEKQSLGRRQNEEEIFGGSHLN